MKIILDENLPKPLKLDSVDLEPAPGAEAAWETEIASRIARFRAGKAKPIPAGEVFARLRQIAPGQ